MPTLLHPLRLALLLAALPLQAGAQTIPTAPAQASKAPPAAAQPPGERDLKRPSGNWPTAPAVMVRESQRTGYAIQLQDYCNDPKVPEDFLQQQFAKLSRITGREENCATVRSQNPEKETTPKDKAKATR